jgi:glycosyltransferase involved in cell wall biosynthesis
METLKYALVTPAHNEELHIEKTILSMVSQSILPLKWVIVNDGSTDKTQHIIEKYTRENNWIELVNLPLHNDRQFAAKVHAFNEGYNKIKNLEFDIIGNLDADISFGKDYFEFLLEKFIENSKLGVAGTSFIEGTSIAYDYNYTNIEHVSGQCQIFRRECFEEIGGYVPIRTGGIDFTAVTTARMKGWQTRTFLEKSFNHHRIMGTGNSSLFKAWFKQGRKDYFLGNHSFWELLRVLYQMKKKPYLCGGALLGLGFFSAAIVKMKKPISAELVNFVRQEQMLRLRKIFLNRIKKR